MRHRDNVFKHLLKGLLMLFLMGASLTTALAQNFDVYGDRCDGKVYFRVYTKIWGKDPAFITNSNSNPARLQYQDDNGSWHNLFSVYTFEDNGTYFSGWTSNGASYESYYLPKNNNWEYYEISWVPDKFNVPVKYRLVKTGQGGENTEKEASTRGAGLPTGLNASDAQYCDKTTISWINPDMSNLVNNCAGAQWEVLVYRGYTYIGSAGQNTFFEDTGGNKGTSYNYRVRIRSTIDNGSTYRYSEYSDANAGSRIGVPSAPTISSATTTNCNQIKVTWTASVNPSVFEVYRSTSYNGTYSKVGETAGSLRDYTDTDPSDRTQTYYYQVKAKNTCGDLSGFSGKVSGKLNAYPSAPSNVRASNNVDKILVQWNDNSSNERGFQIARTHISSGIVTNFTVNAGVTQYEDADVALCEEYKYEISALDPCYQTDTKGGNVTTILTPSLGGFFTSTGLEASKGYYPTKVELSWTPQLRESLIDSYKIYRAIQGTSDSVLVQTLSAGTNFWQDEYAEAGTLYRYSIVGVGTCGDLDTETNVATDVGFRSPSGTVAGQVTYGNGVAVEGVTVLVEHSAGPQGSSLDFDGSGDYIELPHTSAVSLTDAMTIEMWVKPDGVSSTFGLANKTNGSTGFDLSYNGSSKQLNFTAYTNGGVKQAVASNPFTTNQYTHVTAVFNSTFMKLFVDDSLYQTVNTGSALKSNSSNLIVGSASNKSNSFSGNLDEVRVWNTAVSDEDVVLNYNRVLSGNESGLMAYWRMDENTGDHVYDASYQGTNTYNENHGEIVGASWSSDIPTNEQLGLKGITNAQGNYTINNIRYLGSGNNFTLTPYLGVHEFNPNNTILYIGENSLVHNNQNFEDVSSFKVTGSVRYDNTTCYAKDIFVLIDGENVVKNGEPVKTDDNGQFEIEVPIGEHSISVEASGHVFSVGQWPTSKAVHDFQDNVSQIQFIDSTIVQVVGRVVGGTREGDKKPAMGLSTNNIGQATITFTSQQGGGCKVETIQTDPATGEYSINLPPMKYVVTELKVNNNLAIDFGSLDLVDLSVIRPLETVYDTTYSSGGAVIGIDSAKFNVQNDYIYRVEPQISVLNSDNSVFSGDTSVTYTQYLPNNQSRDIEISLVNGSVFNYPVFTEGTNYSTKIKVFENYVNADNTSLTDQVPVTDGAVTIKNNLAQVVDVEDVLTDGEFTYNFVGGLPNTLANQADTATSYTQVMEVVITTAKTQVSWLPNGKPYRGYLLGGLPNGENFVTKGPELVDMILRDPPGSGSYAYMEAGTSKTDFSEWIVGGGATVDLQKRVKLGTKFSVGLGLQVETEVKNTLVAGLEATLTGGDGGALETTYSTSTRFQTSDGSSLNGASSDLFVGKSMNFIYGTTVNVELVPDSVCYDGRVECYGPSLNGFRVGKRLGVYASPDDFATTFIYSRDHIENYLIPDLVQIRNGLFDRPAYTSNILGDHSNYGTNNDDPVWGNSATTTDWLTHEPADYNGPSYKFDTTGLESKVDSIRWYNQQIRLWEEALAENDREKFEVFQKGNPERNISFSAGQSYEFSQTNDTVEVTTHVFDLAVNEKFALVIGAEVQGSGIEVTQSLNIHQTYNETWGDQTTESKTYGYVLNDPDIGDFFSVDVFKSTSGNGPLFKTAGGQSMCPWEQATTVDYPWKEYATVYDTTYQQVNSSYDADTTINFSYYKFVLTPRQEWTGSYVTTHLGKQLSVQTMRRELPTIDADVYTRLKVPEDESAIFNITLGNNSESGDMQWYRLAVVEESNPNGAELKIDGVNLNRIYSIPAGATITKELHVRKGSNEDDYAGLQLVLFSTCEYDNWTNGGQLVSIDTLTINAHFIPSCSDVEILYPDDQWVVNSSFNDTLQVVIGGYDINNPTLENLKFQYKPSSSANWINLETFHADTAGMNDPTAKPIPTSLPYVQYDWDMTQITDGDYDLRAVSTCPLAEQTSATHSGLADRINPHVFGSPQPADGILSPNDELVIQFNEKIDLGKLSYSNFEIKGVLNGTPLNHQSSVSFDGVNDHLKVPSGIGLANRSFSIEFWAKRNGTGAEAIFSEGASANEGVYVGFNSNDELEMVVNGTAVNVDQSVTDNQWRHYAITFDNVNKVAQLFIDGDMIDNSALNVTYGGTGDMYIGRAGFDAQRYFEGNIHEFRIWSTVRTQGELVANMNNSLSGGEYGLIGNWPMDEALGNVAKDKVHSRNAEMNAQWQVLPSGRSYEFTGSDFIELDGSQLAFNEEMDFTIEFWFNSTNSANASLISNGKADGTDANPTGWSISTDGTGAFRVDNNGKTFLATSKSYNDGDWHHFALVVNRAGNTSAYIDGELKKSQLSDQWLGFGGPKLFVGARGWYTGIVQSNDNYFSGKMDEVRVWKMARKQTQIQEDMMHRLNGDEIGLMAYLPFENYQDDAGILLLTETTEDQSSVDKTSTAIGGSHSVLTPNVKLARPVEQVNFTYSVNGDQILFTPTDPAYLIEKTILDITVRDVYDLNGNVLQSPVTWSAYVNKNQVTWESAQFSFTKRQDEQLTFTASIINSGGQQEGFSIDNLPEWLNASPSSGTLEPNSTQEITFTIVEGMNIGTFSQDIYLNTDFNFSEKLLLNVVVFAEAPNWDFDAAAFEQHMSVIGYVEVEDVISVDANDMVAAFVDGELRGVANLQYVQEYDRYLVFLDVYSNLGNSWESEDVQLQVWDASTGKIHGDVTPDLTFTLNNIIGTPSAPQLIAANDALVTNIPLVSGWNWFSISMDSPEANNVETFLDDLTPTNEDVIKNQRVFSQYNGWSEAWYGDLAQLYGNWESNPMNTEEMYMIKVANADTIRYLGTPIDPSATTITLQSGWTWISYLPQERMTVAEALGNLNPSAGDVIRGQKAFAMYDANMGWIGSLQYMEPHHGYKYYAASYKSFNYPAGSAVLGNARVAGGEDAPYQSDTWSVNTHAYQFNMSVVAALSEEDEILMAEDLILGAFNLDSTQGSAVPRYLEQLDKWVYFITIHSNDVGSLINFKLLLDQSGIEYEVQEDLTFVPDGIQGSVDNPFVLSLDRIASVAEPTNGALANVYPNPFQDQVTIHLAQDVGEDATIQVLDLTGRVIADLSNQSGSEITWHSDETSGVYIIRVESAGQVEQHQVVKQRSK